MKDPKRSGTHCVEDSGAKELGEFLWSQFEAFENTEWKQQVVLWLATLMRHTGHWNDVKALNRAATFLGEQLRHRDAIAVHRRALDRIAQTRGLESGAAAVCIHNMGTALELIGDTTDALVQFQSELAIRERLAVQYPANAALQLDLSISYDCIGGILKTQGELAGALAEYRKALAIRERIVAQNVAQNPGNAGWWQDELSMSYDRIGGILEAQGDMAGSFAEYRKALAIRERLAAQDPASADWQRDLSMS